ncbi:hypothetical protein HIM_04976 [Hirsutella minnesotensis 3608]|uniref:Uncharacterized protein n=1 Tax=Hirsutella minnesotensis 3608 TaxID=1043627 RepID=A0A0F7ZUV3_9HYPO|nr:hypothetical protein HIM_04976 [Hirsutella minnesotensis 3608]
MAWELEVLIARLLMLIACAGEKGCSVDDLLTSIRDFTAPPGSSYQNGEAAYSDRAASAIWRWMVRRSDVSVGHKRQYNNLSLSDTLALNSSNNERANRQNVAERQDAEENQREPRNNDRDAPFSQREEIRVYASEATMWEAITGHAIDYKRVPRSEWLLLLGIASTKSAGILQGDLGRLVEQDKRSVPKRTEALLKKGYIVKRTTLVRGTKTSKMWLRSLAPPLPKEGESCDASVATMNLSRHTLVGSLDPVPWNVRWTGQDIDYTALATTIMAVTKEWDVIRVQDLKLKLGVLGMRWQMKIVAKTCRFLNSRGAIRYVAATLNDRVFKDCVKFNRDLTAEDWSLYLATGKRSSKHGRGTATEMDDYDYDKDQPTSQRANHTRMCMCPPWSLDKPLPQTLAGMVRFFADKGISNPDIYALTLGASFNRYLSSLTGSLSTPDIQPFHLKHFQMRSEHVRSGKIASYSFFLPRPRPPTDITTDNQVERASESQLESPRQSANVRFGFAPTSTVPSQKSVSLTILCGLRAPRKRKLREIQPAQGKTTEQVAEDPDVGYSAHAESREDGVSMREKISRPSKRQKVSNLLVTIKVRPEDLRAVMQDTQSVNDLTTRRTRSSTDVPGHVRGLLEGPKAVYELEDIGIPREASGNHKGRDDGRSRGRVRGRPSNESRGVGESPSRPWQCGKCGGSWKNDIGLKYHLEKSKTPCNPSFNPSINPMTRRGKQTLYFRPDDLTSGERLISTLPETPGAGLNFRDEDSTQIRSGDSQVQKKLQGVLGRQQCSKGISGNATGEAQIKMSSQSQVSRPTLTETREILPIYSPSHTDRRVLLQNQSTPLRQLQPSRNCDRELGEEDKSVEPLRSAEGSVTDTTIQPGEGRDVFHDQKTSRLPRSDFGSRTDPGNEKSGGKIGHNRSKRELISKVIFDHLDQQSGVALGGKHLWEAISNIWTHASSDASLPTERDCQVAVNSMLRRKLISEHCHVFRDHKGMFAKCQLILRPGIDAFCPMAVSLIEKAKELQQKPQFSRTENDPQAKRFRTRGRRLLAKEVAVLDAPVYAAQAAAKRATEASSGSPHRAKRARLTTGPVQGDGTLDTKPPVIQQYPRSEYEALARTGSDKVMKIPPSPETVSSVRFLLPNTCLEDNLPECEAESSPPADSQLWWTFSSDRLKEAHNRQAARSATGQQQIVFDDIQVISGDSGVWPYHETEEFETLGTSFTMSGWMPGKKWHRWATFKREVEKRYAVLKSHIRASKATNTPYTRFSAKIQACLDVETSRKTGFANALPTEAGPHNLFVSHTVDPGDFVSMTPPTLLWSTDGPFSLTSTRDNISDLDDVSSSFTDYESEPESLGDSHLRKLRPKAKPPTGPVNTSQARIKRVALVTRSLTALPLRDEVEEMDSTTAEEPERVMAAFVAVRSLLGGADKAMDWGLLARLFPNLGVVALRRMWVDIRKEQAAYVSNFTRLFQHRLIVAFENEELPMINYEKPLEYDWQRLIRWTMRLPRQEGIQVPRTRDSLARQYVLEEREVPGEDWREKYFHPLSSFFARYESISSDPATITNSEALRALNDSPNIDDLVVARSWIKSVCSTAEGNFSVEQVKTKFLELSPGDKQRRSDLFKEAAMQLMQQRIICKSQKHFATGRPYRLNEWYVSVLARMAQSKKYDAAAAFKKHLDATFRRQKSIKVPYTLDDGAMMALTNLSATKQILLVPVNVPDVPFGFEPGNYESRKYPKSYYHFALEAVPTASYLYNEDIEVLQLVVEFGPPKGGARGELPQWIDFKGQSNMQLWSDLLGAFCFAFATRGSMTVEGICSALSPLLDDFEADLIIQWGKRVGLLTDLMGGCGITVGDWWWLVVPWLRQREGAQKEKT